MNEQIKKPKSPPTLAKLRGLMKAGPGRPKGDPQKVHDNKLARQRRWRESQHYKQKIKEEKAVLREYRENKRGRSTAAQTEWLSGNHSALDHFEGWTGKDRLYTYEEVLQVMRGADAMGFHRGYKRAHHSHATR